MSKLAINGGKKVFENPPKNPPWPPVYPETGDQIREIYMSRKWSFYGEKEVEFNRAFAEYTGAAGCAMMANGTVTLEVAMQAMGIGPGDEVIVPAHTWLATGEAVVVCGATPVIVDIEPDTLCMDPEKIEEAITPRTKAIIPVHLFGSMADMDRIMPIARKHGLKVIEDCAHMHGGRWNGKHAGTIGDVGSFSFQQSKGMSSGEGGACITMDPALCETIGRLSHIGYQYASKQGQASTPPPMGLICHNYRITEFQALILLSQLAHLDEYTQLRARNAEILRKRLDAIDGLQVQAPGRHATTQGYYLYAVKVDPARLKDGITRKELMEALQAEGLAIWSGWGKVMYKQTLWSVPENLYRISSSDVAERIVTRELMCMPLNTLMLSEEETEKEAECFEKVMSEYGR